MRELALKSLVRNKKGYKSYTGLENRVAPNILQRQFKTEKHNHKWTTNITEFKIGNKNCIYPL